MDAYQMHIDAIMQERGPEQNLAINFRTPISGQDQASHPAAQAVLQPADSLPPAKAALPAFRCGELPPEAKAENPQAPPSACKQPHQTRPSRVQRSSAEDRHHTARNYIRFFRQNNATASGSGNAPRLKYIQASPLSAAHNLPSGLRKLLFRCRYAKPPASRAYI